MCAAPKARKKKSKLLVIMWSLSYSFLIVIWIFLPINVSLIVYEKYAEERYFVL